MVTVIKTLIQDLILELCGEKNPSCSPINYMKSSRIEVFTVLPENNAGLCLTLVM